MFKSMRLLWKINHGTSFLRRFYVVFSLLLLPFSLLLSLLLFSNPVNATVITDTAFSESNIYGKSGSGSFSSIYHSDSVGGPVIDLDLSNGYGEIWNYVGSVYYYQPELTCSDSSTVYPVYTLFADNVHPYIYTGNNTGGDGLGQNYYNESYYGTTNFRAHYVEEDSENDKGFAYGVYLPQRDLPQSSNNSFLGQYSSTLAFSFYPFNAVGSTSSNVPVYLEILGVNSFCSRDEALAFISNYIFQDSRPEEDEPDSPIVSEDFPYTFDSDSPENNQELYDAIISQDPTTYQPQIGDGQTILNWFANFLGEVGAIPDDPHDYRCNVVLQTNTQNMIKFDMGDEVRFSACENEFVYAINDDSTRLGGDSGVSTVQNPGRGTMFTLTLKGIMWLFCFILIYQMLRNFYYYVYEIVNYSFSLEGSEGVI